MTFRSSLIFICAGLFAIPAALADDSGAKSTPPIQSIAAAIKKVVFSPSTPPSPTAPKAPAQTLTDEQDALVFTAPPRETPEEGVEMYKPIADYMSQVIGKKVRYKHPGTWGVYRTEMLKGSYDIVFDGPHFNGYRMEKLSHNILVRIPERHEFAVIIRKDTIGFQHVSQMAGRTFCTHAPPNLGTLVLLSQFDNPARQPVIINTKGWDQIYEGVVSGKCVGGILPVLNLRKYDKTGATRIVYKTPPMPNQAFSAGPRVSLEDQAKLAQALSSPDAAGPTAKLRAAYKVGDHFALATNDEYRGLAEYLRNEWGYY